MALVQSAIVLLAAHIAARPDPKPVRWGLFLTTALFVTLFPGCGLFISAVAPGLSTLLAVGLLGWTLTRRRVRTFLPYSVAAVLIAYGSAGWVAWGDYDRMTALRARHPFESMTERVPEPRGGGGMEPAAADHLTAFDGDVTQAQRYSWRASEFFRLHEQTVEAFVNSPGFGQARMRSPVSERSLQDRSERGDPPPQPTSPGPAWEADFAPVAGRDARAAFDTMHAAALIDFVNPAGWGYVRSRREVAGFLPHAFSRVPAAPAWKVERVELVGLLRHPEPVVYPSDRLPAMADLAAAPTRPPDAFEAAGVAAVRRGDDGFAAARGGEVRFVGAVRSAAACVGCHGGNRGDLLGAFAYRLRPAGR